MTIPTNTAIIHLTVNSRFQKINCYLVFYRLNNIIYLYALMDRSSNSIIYTNVKSTRLHTSYTDVPNKI